MQTQANGDVDLNATRVDITIDVASRRGERLNGENTEPRVLYRLLSSTMENELQQESRRDTMQAPSLRRAVTRTMSTLIDEWFWCPVCFEKHLVSRAVALSACGHRYCRDCATAYVESKIADGQIYPVCFFVDPEASACGAHMSADDIRRLVAADVWAKYEVFRFNKENTNGRQCPYCGHSQVCRGPKDPICTCNACHQVFCFTHANAHPDGIPQSRWRRFLDAITSFLLLVIICLPAALVALAITPILLCCQPCTCRASSLSASFFSCYEAVLSAFLFIPDFLIWMLFELLELILSILCVCVCD